MTPRASAGNAHLLKMDLSAGLTAAFVAPAILIGAAQLYPRIVGESPLFGKYAPHITLLGLLGTRLVVDAIGIVSGAEAEGWMEKELVISALLLFALIYILVVRRNIRHATVYFGAMALVLFATSKAFE